MILVVERGDVVDVDDDEEEEEEEESAWAVDGLRELAPRGGVGGAYMYIP
jgi:hypothetical protein